MANEDQRLLEQLDSLLSEVDDYACRISLTAVETLVVDNRESVDDVNSGLLSIEELALQLQHFVLMCKEKMKGKVRRSEEEESPEDDVDPDDLVPADWVPDDGYMGSEVDEFDSDGYPTDEYVLREMFYYTSDE